MTKSKKSVTNQTIVGMNNEVALLLIVIVAIIVILFFNRTKCTKESFITEHMTEGFQDENRESNIYISSKNIKQEGDNIILTIGNETQTIPFNNFEKGDVINLNNFYEKGSTIESETIKLLKQKNETIQNDYDEFRKTILDSRTYQLKNSIPKIECPPCINPKVNVDAALCKKCPPVPEPQTCDDDNNKSQPACVNKYTVITRNIYKKNNNSNNNSNLLIEEEENQTKINYNNKMTNGLNTNNTNPNINNNNNQTNIVVEEENFYNSLNKMNRTNSNTNTNNVRTNSNTNSVRTNSNTNNVRTNRNANNVRTNRNTNINSNINTIGERQLGELNHSFKLAAKPVNGYSF